MLLALRTSDAENPSHAKQRSQEERDRQFRLDLERLKNRRCRLNGQTDHEEMVERAFERVSFSRDF